MSMADTLFSHNLSPPPGGVPPSSSRSRPHAGHIATATALGFAKVSAVGLAAHRASVLVRAMSSADQGAGAPKPTSSSGTDQGSGTEGEEGTPSNLLSGKPAGGVLNLSLPNVPVWARWVLGSMVVLAVPFYKKFMRMEDEVEKTVETAVEVVEEVAKVTKNVVSDLAEALPADGSLRKVVVEVEEITEVVIADSEMTKSFILKVDEIKEEVETVVEPIIKEGDIFGKEEK